MSIVDEFQVADIRNGPILVETWTCDRCGHVEKIEIMEEGDGIIGEWMCARIAHRHAPMCGGLYSQGSGEGVK